MSSGRLWGIFSLALVYAAGVSLYVAAGTVGTKTAAPSATVIAVFMFGWLLAGGVVFALMVALLDLLTRRNQQFFAALALGLTISATFEAVTEIAFEQSYANLKFEHGASPAPDKNN